jgi:surface antigen
MNNETMRKNVGFGAGGSRFRRATAVVSIVSMLGVPTLAAAGDDDRRGRGRGSDRWSEGRHGDDRSESRWRREWRDDDRDRRRTKIIVREERHRHFSPPPRDWRPDWQRFRGRHWDHHPTYGWRFERRPGLWSPYYRWWWLDGRSVLALAPETTIIRYPDGYYRLVGDGFGSPYYWTWVPHRVAVVAPPPPVYPEFAPDYAVVEEEPVVVQEPVVRRSGGGREAAGTILGGVAGGILGSTVGRGNGKIAGVLAGTLLGAIVGNNVGRSLDDADELHAAHVLEKNRTGQASTWVNPDSGAAVTVVPKRTYQAASGDYCREYQTEVEVGGQRQLAYGTACRQPDGQWKIVK